MAMLEIAPRPSPTAHEAAVAMRAGSAPVRALVIDGDEGLASATRDYLEGRGLVVSCVADGRQGLAEALRAQHDVVVLEIALPRQSGLEICRQLRSRSAVPVIITSVLDGEADRILGLEMGADDYLTKPFSVRELLARIHTVLRRARREPGAANGPIRVGQLALSTSDYRATLAGRPLDLTTGEFVLLQALAERAGRVLSREQLLDLTKGSAEVAFDRSIDAHVSRIRHKLGEDPRRPRLVKTVRGVGYVLSAGLDEE
jgi:DNA-binding response OmpR family regulator